MTPTATETPPARIGPAEPEMPSTGWFASSARDELTRIRGIDDLLNTRLFGLGVVRFEDVEMLSAEDEMALEERLQLPAGTIARDQWRAQAAFFRAGRNNEPAAHPAPAEPAPVG
jgi:predicted flap endonuclease-1-like 5' DNA nuclease